MAPRQQSSYGRAAAPMSSREGAYGPTRYKPSVPALQLRTLPVYAVNTEQVFLVALEKRMDEKDTAQVLCDEWTDQLLDDIFCQVSMIVVGLPEKTFMQLSRNMLVDKERPPEVTPVMLADRAPPDWRWSDCCWGAHLRSRSFHYHNHLFPLLVVVL